jgi:hypothetical protein
VRPFRPNEYPLDRCVRRHAVQNEDGERSLVFRCELCGTESADPALQRGCWVCDGRVGWR